MAGYLRVKNWEQFQHYADRSPPWIKLHRSVLDDYEFSSLPDASKAHLMLIWLLASSNDGRIPSDPAWLTRRLATTETLDLQVLVAAGFLLPEHDASALIAPCKHDASKVLDLARSREKRREEKSREGAFATFWQAYPRRKSRGQAEKAFAKLNPSEQLLAAILAGIERAKTSEQWTRDDGKFIPYPATWLNAKGWEDEDLPTAALGSEPWAGAI